jgi:hypothetical protein
MDNHRWSVGRSFSARALTTLVLAALVLATLAGPPRIAVAQGGIIVDSVTSEPFGTFDGIPYVKYEGRFDGLASGDYDVPFELVAPADPALGNGIVIIEPFHIMGGAAGIKGYLTLEFLFGQGFSYAGIGWHPDWLNPLGGYSTAEAVEIVGNFAMALREDASAAGLAGSPQKLYAVGTSLTTEPLLSLLDSPGAGLLDFTLLFVPEWPAPTYTPPEEANSIMVLLTESDLVRSAALGLHTDAMRVSAQNYRLYEVGGAPHIADVPFIREIGPPWGLFSEGTTPLDWTPVARALFVAGHRWATEGTEPPPSVSLAEAPEGQPDPVYQSMGWETGIARDENLNALGGIRMPDLEIGRGLYIAVDPGSVFLLLGDWTDLQCEPLAGGGNRFRNHGAYVSEFAHQAQRLVRQGYLLPQEADHLISQAAESEVGKPLACDP